ncbi:MAG: tRNA (cytidine(56)-2'-O)-methyltransferase [Candidatus Bathyarchaeales archaeon]
MQKVAVLRWGHRAFRDERLTTHLVLAARAFGASEFFLADVEDEKIKATIERTVRQWGGPFSFKMGIPWREIVNDWKAKDGTVVHLTMYGENIQTSDVIQRIKKTRKHVLVIVGSQKVPSEFYKISDFNVAIGNQPHSECSSLAVFLDRLFEGKGLEKEFEDWRIKLIPELHGKHVVKRNV